MANHSVNNIYGFIYKTILPDGRYYIGQHKIINHITLDPAYFGSGVIIRDYIKAKGTAGLLREILAFECNNIELNLLESRIITKEMLNDPLNINLDLGGRHKCTRSQDINDRIGNTMSIRRAENPHNWPSRTGVDNNKSMNWKLISPTNEEFLICGGLNQFCQHHRISAKRTYFG